jgi:alpha/beta superfamily hydrolase
MGAWMSNVYFQNTPNSPYAAWVVIGVTGRILSLGQNSLPVLDVYGENDLAASVSKAWLRRVYLWIQPQSLQVMMPGSDHHHAGKEKALANVIVEFVGSRLQSK